MRTPGTIVDATDIRKMYGDVKAIDGVSFSVMRGEVFGIVGPNGAGKTTTMDCIVGMRKQDSGTVRVLGLDPQKQGMKLRNRLGIQLQESELPDRIRVREAMELFSSFYTKTTDWRVLLKGLNLHEKTEVYFSTLSGGQKRRLFIALALVGSPEVVFLDELTSGLDPQARRTLWKLVQDMKKGGVTVFLSTHYMDEAEKLCDRIAIIDHGRIVALDSPANLISSLGRGLKIIFSAAESFAEDTLESILGVVSVHRHGNRITVDAEASGVVVEIVRKLDDLGVSLDDFHTERTTLEDVFLALTGKEMRD